MAAAQAKAVTPALLIAAGALLMLAVFALLHDNHYRERRLQMLEHEMEGVRKILSGKHGRTA